MNLLKLRISCHLDADYGMNLGEFLFHTGQ